VKSSARADLPSIISVVGTLRTVLLASLVPLLIAGCIAEASEAPTDPSTACSTQTYARLHGVNSSVALYCLSILNAASLFGRIIPNWLADRYGPFTILIPNCVASGVLVFAWLGMCKTTIGTIFFSILYGLSSGA